MGTTVYASLVVGALVDASELTEKTTSVNYKCDGCETSHKAKAKFCSECGTSLKQVTKTELKQSLLDQGWNSLSDILSNVRAISFSMDRDPAITAVVEELGQVVEYQRQEVCEISTDEVFEATVKVRQTLTELGLNADRPVKLYLKLYYSV